jgi:branched-chain amino acid transport system ATP-binding protein
LTREEREDLAHFILKTKQESNIPIIWIEHDLQMVGDIADRILVLDVGRVIAEGPPQKVLRDPAVISAYIGAVTNG